MDTAETEAVLFDFNGVLLWDTEWHDLAWRDYSKEIRGEALTDDEMIHKVHGRTNKDVLEYLLNRSVSHEELADHIIGKESTYQEICLSRPDEFVLSPGAIEFLDWLEDNDTPKTIATSSDKGNVDFFFEHLDLARWFDYDRVAYDDGSIKGKPEPDLYLKAAEILDVHPGTSMVIEDSKSGIASANNAAVGIIIAIGPEDNHSELSSVEGVDLVVADFHELLKLQQT